MIVDGTGFGSQTAVYVPVNRSIKVSYSRELEWVWQRV
jgi:hypothetical protein